MAEIIHYRKEFLPQVIRLFYPEDERIDGRFPYFQQRFALYQPAPEQSCLLLKGPDKLLALVHLVPLAGVQPDLLYANIVLDSTLSSEQWDPFWERCLELARSLVSGASVLRTAARETSVLQEKCGFKVVREQVEMHASLGDLPPVQERSDSFRVVSLADAPHRQQAWLDIFNQGLAAFYNLQPMDVSCLQRLQGTPGYDGNAFRLGLEGEEAVAALFYWVLDGERGMVHINAPSSGGSGRSFGRRMLKETLNHLDQKGFKEAILCTDAASQATNLLYKMLGFLPQERIKIMEYRLPLVQAEVAPVEEKAAPTPSPNQTEGQGFFTTAHSAFEPRKKAEKKKEDTSLL